MLSMCVMLTTWMMWKSVSPMKLSFFLVVYSLLMSMNCYIQSNSVFLMGAMVISFSSGMMILFCYCSMLTKYENNKTTNMKTAPLFFILISTSLISLSKENLFSPLETSMGMSNSLLPLFMMMVVGVTILCVNMNMFIPSKNFMESYWWKKKIML